jgi:ABC-2 type transport system ATP-binding protein
MKPPDYSINRLTKIYKNGNILANDQISLEIPRGEVLGIFGPNGAGKTTLVRQMAGLIRPTSGTLELKGIDILEHPNIIPHYVAYFAQAPWILWSLKVWEVVYFTGIFRGMPKKEARVQTERLLMELGLHHIRERLMERLSGGESKLLGIAASLIGQQPILILDEPTNELDPINRIKIWNLFSRLRQENNITIILVTHNVLEAEQVVDRVIIIDQGKVIANGTPGELKARIDDRVRIEIKLKPHRGGSTTEFLQSFADSKQLTPDKWQIFVPKSDISSVYNRLTSRIRLEDLDDFRLMTTTLEDVYIRMGGSRSTEEFNGH